MSTEDRASAQVAPVGVPTEIAPHDVVARGQQAWGRLRARERHTWEDWTVVGAALVHGRHLVMLEAGTNEPKGTRYKVVFGDWLRVTGFHEIDKGDRARLIECMEHRDKIETWRTNLPLNDRLKLNHPNSVWRHWQRSTNAGKATVTTSPIAKLKDEVARLEDENARLHRAGDDLFARQDTAADIARVIADHLLRLSPGKSRQVLDLLPDVFAEQRARREADEPMKPARSKKRRRTADDFRRDIEAKHREPAP